MLRTTTYRWAAIAGGLTLAGLVTPTAAAATTLADPPGNNGTVKIDGVAFDDHPNNEPHVGCVFQVDLYGFDQGDLDATITFTLVPPTAANDDITVDDLAIGEDPAGGGTDLDATATYDLSDALTGVEPHAQQGIHLRLTVHADGSQGADTKFKELWLTGCGSVPTTTTSTTKPGHGGSTTTSSTPSSSSTSQPGGSTTSTQPGHGGGSSTSQTSNPPGGPATTAPTGGHGGGGSGAAGQLPHTGSNVVPLAATGLALTALGATAALTARRLHHARNSA
jgi:hypothetical protein